MRIENQSLLQLALLLVCCLQPAHSQTTFTPSEMETMLQVIDGYFFVASPSKNMEIRKFLRAAFHDCMGGCDGSINLAKTDNRGLESFVDVVTGVYTILTNPHNAYYSYFKRLTRADFWALCESRALGWGIKKSGVTPTYNGVPFVAGRPAALSSNNSPSETTLPNGAGAWSAMLSVFKTGLPVLTETDIVTLLGLHGCGIAEPTNSGFKGPWGPAQDKNVVNNRFFVSLLNLGFPQSFFIQKQASTAAFPSGNTGAHTSPDPPSYLVEWTISGQNGNPAGSPGKMMLPIDMQIYHSFTPDSTGRTNQGQYCSQGTNPTLTACRGASYLPLAKNAPTAFNYAKSNTLFLNALIPAFVKMLSNFKASANPYTHGWVCVNKVAKCLGDIFFTGCTGVAPKCP